MTKQEKQTFGPFIDEYQQLETEYKTKQTEMENMIKTNGHTSKTDEISKQIMDNRIRSMAVIKNIVTNVITMYKK